MSTPLSNDALFTDIGQLIQAARSRAAVAVNAELTLLYWQIGRRIQQDVLQGDRAQYGKQIVEGVARQLTDAFGKGWSPTNLCENA